MNLKLDLMCMGSVELRRTRSQRKWNILSPSGIRTHNLEIRSLTLIQTTLAGILLTSQSYYCRAFVIVVCEDQFWGVNCSKTCACVEASGCDPVSGCLCDKGWRGEHCDQDIDECQEDPDLCNDTMKECINEDGFFSCICTEGYVTSANGTCEGTSTHQSMCLIM